MSSMLHGEMRQRTTNRVSRPELVVWTSLWGRSLAYVMGEAEQKSRFSYALRRAMGERHVSARSLAKTLGVDARRVTGWLNGKALPNLYESQALAVALIALIVAVEGPVPFLVIVVPGIVLALIVVWVRAPYREKP